MNPFQLQLHLYLYLLLYLLKKRYRHYHKTASAILDGKEIWPRIIVVGQVTVYFLTTTSGGRH